MMKYIPAILIFLLLSVLTGYSQQLWTLEDCIEYAMENNIQLKRQELQSDAARNNYNTSWMRVLPGVSAFADHYFNSGRALNYDTYQWENRAFEQGNLGIQGSLSIFGGFQNHHNIQEQRYLLLFQLQQVERARNDLSLNIASAYLQILLDMDLKDIAAGQLEVSTLEVEAAKVNFNLGNISMGRLLEVESQNAANEYQLTMARNNLSNSYLNLIQILQLDPEEDFRIARPEELEINESVILNSISDIYDQAEQFLPHVRAAEYFVKSREKQLSLARGQLSPRLGVRGLFYTRYSEIALDPVTGSTYGGYLPQLKDNRYLQFGVSLVIPIFDGWNARNRISNARISVLDATYQLEETRQNLYSEIHQMYNNAINTYNRFNSADRAVSYAMQTSEHAGEQFRLGLINFVDYQHSQASLFRASSDRAQAKYEYFLRSMILDFYLGEPLEFN